MQQFYFSLYAYFSFLKDSKHVLFATRYVRRVLPIILLWTAHVTHAQQTFFEDFNNRDDAGSLPEGWTVWQNGGGGGDPSPSWSIFREVWAVNQYVMSIEEPGRDGMKDEDWMIMPKITPVAGDYLMFNARRDYMQKGDMFYLLVSKTSAQAPAAFKDTLAVFTEDEMPQNIGNVNKLRVSLSKYVNVPIYIAFVHVADVGSEDISSFWVIDDVEVRARQKTFVKDAIFHQMTTPPQPPVVQGDLVVFAGTVQLQVTGDFGKANLTSMSFSLDGTTDPSMIKEVMVYYTPFEGVTDQDILDEVLPRFGTIKNPGRTFTITGNQELEIGPEPYMYIRYILDETRALTFPYPQIDVSCEKFVVDGVERAPSVQSFFGTIDVVPPVVFNDNFADAVELSPVPARYGSSTRPATYEPEHDDIVYCHNFGDKRVHSVWYYFVAPAHGFITADLTHSHFNTIVAFLDEDKHQLACSDDLSETQTQSVIANFPVRAGQKIYVRVSDLGSPENNDNQYRYSGVVIMDFSFSTPMGADDDRHLLQLSDPYPNPSSGILSFELATVKPGPVQVYLRDIAGRLLYQENHSFSAGKRVVTLDAGNLSEGLYLLQVEGHGESNVRKVMISQGE
jgi:hypothetical protein